MTAATRVRPPTSTSTGAFGSPPRSVRDRAVDHARGVASLIMIQGHAFHAWTAPAHKLDADYRATRIFATLPLPAFLVLAGAAVAYRLAAAQRKGQPRREVASALCKRGLQVMATGYAVSLAYALMDGMDGIATLLRADVLQLIGLSITVLGACVGVSTAPTRVSLAAGRILALGVLVTLACAPLSQWAAEHSSAWSLPTQALLGLWLEVPPITRMPFFPLFGWAAMGFGAGAVLCRAAPARRTPTLLVLSLLAGVLIVAGHGLQDALLGNEVLSRSHPALIGNTLAFGARGLLVLGLAPLLVALLPKGAQEVCEHMGRTSLWAYVFHIPFCYGRLGSALYAKLSVVSALPYVVLLMVASYGIVRLRLATTRRVAA